MSEIDKRVYIPKGRVEACDALKLDNPKLRSLPECAAWREQLRAQGRKVVLTNGVFDLLHTGHLHFLKAARKEGGALFVALNSDESVRAIKGPLRPVQTEQERAFALAALECVDAIVIFRTPRLTQEIRALRPDVYCKAGDYLKDPLNPRDHKLNPEESAALDEVGASKVFLTFLPGFSTTKLIAKIRAAGEV